MYLHRDERRRQTHDTLRRDTALYVAPVLHFSLYVRRKLRQDDKHELWAMSAMSGHDLLGELKEVLSMQSAGTRSDTSVSNPRNPQSPGSR